MGWRRGGSTVLGQWLGVSTAVASRTGDGGAATTRDGEVDDGGAPANERPRDYVSDDRNDTGS